MRISDWSSDVCSSDLRHRQRGGGVMGLAVLIPLSIAMGLVGLVAFCWALKHDQFEDPDGAAWRVLTPEAPPGPEADRKSVVEGKRVSVRVDLGGRRIITKKKSIVQPPKTAPIH